jgi:hypothetical protein
MVMLLLTLVMAIWMYLTRVSAMKRLRIHPQKGQDTSKLKDLLPDEVTRISNNYNHLFEQPTVFYAVVLVIALLGHVDQVHIICAWVYTGLRIVHSLIQATVDKVYARFIVFVLSWIVLAVILIRESITIFTM